MPVYSIQREKIFWGPRTPKGQVKLPAPSNEDIAWEVNWRDNRDCPFHNFIGNETAKDMLSTVAFNALQYDNHVCREVSLSIIGPSGCGKTTLVRMLVKLLGLPLVEIHPKAIKSVEDFADKLHDDMEDTEIPLIPYQDENEYILPPMVVFIDEVHALSDSVVQALLKATEKKDHSLECEDGRSYDTYNVLWIIATTDVGKLFDAFRTRFMNLELFPLDEADLAKVILLNNPGWPAELGALVARYVPRSARKALEFASYMRMVHNMGNRTWEDAARLSASHHGYNEHGLHRDEVAILEALSKGPVAKKRIVYVLPGKKEEEVERYVLPPLMSGANALVRVGRSGYVLTEAGQEKLEELSLE